MRFFEISSGVRVPVNEEEQLLINIAVDKGQLRPSDLDERKEEVVRLMVNRGILNIESDDDGIFYEPNDAADLWRF
ncbi:MAG: hypothetical protein EOP83_01175 [Verrucomicrobiaceae bacterium]|nr:MAG: hypothetical protein EOP83_01175 [Verrucomicrobiaceae bacterium]